MPKLPQVLDRWNNALRGPPPKDGKIVQLCLLCSPFAVEAQVLPGHWNEKRQMYFSGERPVFPSHWRLMAKPPKRRT